MKTCDARFKQFLMFVRKLVCGGNAEATTLGCALLALGLTAGIGPAQAQDALMIGEDGKVTVNAPLAVTRETSAEKVTVNGPLTVMGETTAEKVTVDGPLVKHGNATMSNAFVRRRRTRGRSGLGSAIANRQPKKAMAFSRAAMASLRL